MGIESEERNERKMKRETGKASRKARKVMAVIMAAVLCLSTLTITPPAKAAVKTKPTLAVKKKTLYYNKSGKKTYTLKVKKNKVKKISKTTWKTSKKSVVSISKKKKTSVKLTAKKKGTATITATIRYVPKGMWMVRTLKLKCKITSKKASAKKPKKTPKPSETPNSQTAAKVELDKDELAFNSTSAGENTDTLTAAAYDKKGEELKNAVVTWKSDDEKVVQVSAKGVVTAKKEGTANIRASVGTTQSAPCVVTVDTKAPSVEGALITDYKTITVYFDEVVEGDPEVSVTSVSDEEGVDMEAELAKDGKSLTLACDHALSAGKYKIQIDGLTDHVRNELQNNAVTVEKKASTAKKIICMTDEVPQGQSTVTVYYAVLDQYGEEMAGSSISGLKASAKTESGMPLDASLNQQKKCVVISGAVSMLAEGKKILVTLSSTGISAELETVVVDGSDAGKAAKIGRVAVSSTKMKMEGSEETPEFTLTKTAADNEFVLKAELLDKFGLQAEKAGVVYVIGGDSDAVEFVDSEGSNSKTTNIADSDTEVRVKALKGGTASITAYLVADDSQRKDIQVTIHPTALESIMVGELPEGYNNQPSEAKVTLTPVGTGMTAADLEYEYVKGDLISEERTESIKFKDENGAIYVEVTAKADGSSDPIKFYVKDKKTGIRSVLVTYKSSPLPVVESIQVESFKDPISVNSTDTTSYQLLNRYGEDITNNTKVSGTVTAIPSETADAIYVGNIIAEKGVLSVKGVSANKEGEETTIKLTYNNGSASAITQTVKVSVVASARLSHITFGESEVDREVDLIEDLPGQNSESTKYIALKAYDQYKKKYRLTATEAGQLKISIGGEDVGAANLPIRTEFYKEGSGDYAEATGNDEVSAIRIKWDKGPGDYETIPVSFKDNLNSKDFQSDVINIKVRPARQISRLCFEKDAVSAAEGSPVENKISVMDQYASSIPLDGVTNKIGIRVTDEKGEIVTLTPSAKVEKKADDWFSRVNIEESGIYTVTVYVYQGTDHYTSTSIQASYTLTVDEASQMIDTIAIDDKVTVTDDDINININLSEVDCVKLNTRKEIKLSYLAYDEAKNPIILKDDSIPSNDRVWSILSKDGVEAMIDQDGKVTAEMLEGRTKGSITVQLNYMRSSNGTKKDIRTIVFSSELPVAKEGTYKVVAAEKLNVDEDTPGISKENAVITRPKDYKIWAKDQYGDWFAITDVYTAVSDDDKAAKINITRDPLSPVIISVIPQSAAKKETDIHVHVKENEILSFHIETEAETPEFEEKDVTNDFTGKAADFATTYYNEPKGTDFGEVDDGVCYFGIRFKEGTWNNQEIASVSLDGEMLNKGAVKISVGNSNFIELPDYKVTADGLMISYVFTALHDTNPTGEMHFTVKFKNGTSSDAVLKVSDLQDGFKCTDIAATHPDLVEVTDVKRKTGNNSITECTLKLDPASATGWNHLILLAFSDQQNSTYYFTKKIVDGNVSYGFTGAENGDGDLGYYPHRYGTGKVVTEYTVATAERYGVAKIKLIKEDKELVTAD